MRSVGIKLITSVSFEDHLRAQNLLTVLSSLYGREKSEKSPCFRRLFPCQDYQCKRPWKHRCHRFNDKLLVSPFDEVCPLLASSLFAVEQCHHSEVLAPERC